MKIPHKLALPLIFTALFTTTVTQSCSNQNSATNNTKDTGFSQHDTKKHTDNTGETTNNDNTTKIEQDAIIFDTETGDCEAQCTENKCGDDKCGGYCNFITYDHNMPLGEKTALKYTICIDNVYTKPGEHCSEGWCTIPACSFQMGPIQLLDISAADIYKTFLNEPHTVYLTSTFKIMQTEVTQALWTEIMGGDNPSYYSNCGMSCPVENITLFDMINFANNLSEKAGLEKCYELINCNRKPSTKGHGLVCESAEFKGQNCKGYRLPSEAEWELAVNNGSSLPYPNGWPEFGQNNCYEKQPLAEQAWFCGNCKVDYDNCDHCDVWDCTDICCGTHPVAEKNKNLFGIYDGMGNVKEATGSIFTDPTQKGIIRINPGFDTTLTGTVAMRGGSFFGTAYSAAAIFRQPGDIGKEGFRAIGFRLAKSIE